MIGHYKYTEKELDELIHSMVILIDTREKVNDHILKYFDKANIQWIDWLNNNGIKILEKNNTNSKLYKCRDEYFDKQIVVERKGSLEELSGNLTKERDRLEKELCLAPSSKVLVIENATYGDMVSGNYETKYNNKSYWASVHSFWHKYQIPIVFLKDKNYTGFFIRGYFEYYLRNHL